ncbi:MAG TPA: cell division protein ZapB [Deltaproteobacteria bacterium]|nr:cell division protein ZapB [Deltaproteobacteria bacterium]
METLDVLENKIHNLLETADSLKKNTAELTEKLIQKEEEAKGLRQEIEDLLAEKERVRERVAHLIKCVEVF